MLSFTFSPAIIFVQLIRFVLCFAFVPFRRNSVNVCTSIQLPLLRLQQTCNTRRIDIATSQLSQHIFCNVNNEHICWAPVFIYFVSASTQKGEVKTHGFGDGMARFQSLGSIPISTHLSSPMELRTIDRHSYPRLCSFRNEKLASHIHMRR